MKKIYDCCDRGTEVWEYGVMFLPEMIIPMNDAEAAFKFVTSHGGNPMRRRVVVHDWTIMDTS